MTRDAVTPEDRRRLEHIRSAVDRALRYAAPGRSTLDDERTRDAVLHCLTVVGEALGALTPAAYALLPSLPRHRPKAQRNLIVHAYWAVDPDLVWETIRTDLPRLRAEIDAILG